VYTIFVGREAFPCIAGENGLLLLDPTGLDGASSCGSTDRGIYGLAVAAAASFSFFSDPPFTSPIDSTALRTALALSFASARALPRTGVVCR